MISPVSAAPHRRRSLVAAASLWTMSWICLGCEPIPPPMLTETASAESTKAMNMGSPSPGVWHTRGATLLDPDGRPFKMVGLNWSGFETTNGIPGGLNQRDYKAVLRSIRDGGFNVIRLPLSNEMVESPHIPSGLEQRRPTGFINEDLRGLTSMQVLDKVVSYSQEIGLKLILDNHRSNAGSGPQENGLWFTSAYPESSWLGDWASLARRYVNSPSVIGFDLRNEPHGTSGSGACWDCGGERDWHVAAQHAGNAILKENRNLLIIVEGVDEYGGDQYWWGGNLEGVRRSPVILRTPNHLVYSPHEYGPVEYPQPWFTPTTSSQELEQTWVKHWAFISDLQIAPVYIGEFGTPNDAASIESVEGGSQGQWYATLVSFLSKRSMINWTYWSANGEDRYAYFDPSYSQDHSSQLKMSSLDAIRGTIAVDMVPRTRGVFYAELSSPGGHTYTKTFTRIPTKRFRYQQQHYLNRDADGLVSHEGVTTPPKARSRQIALPQSQGGRRVPVPKPSRDSEARMVAASIRTAVADATSKVH